jgi:hypothetical protein
MILRFEVNQAEAFRRGVDVPKSTNHLEVNPADLSQEERSLIADRLEGIDVCELDEDGERLFITQSEADNGKSPKPSRLVANLPTLEALMEAIRENEGQVDRKMKISNLLQTLRDMAKINQDAKVFIVHDGQMGQWPIDSVKLSTANASGIGMAVLANAGALETEEDKALTVKSLIERLSHGWPEGGEVRVAYCLHCDGGEARPGPIRRVEWKTLIEQDDPPRKERVVAIVV